MAVVFWVLVFAVALALFIWLWRMATRIEEQEEEERRWMQWVESMSRQYPMYAWHYQRMFEEKFLK